MLEEVLMFCLAGPIEHIGSTAVPGLAAKPVIDIMARVRSLELSRAVIAIAAAESAGYCYYPYKSEAMHRFCKPSPAYRTHHLHLVPTGSRLWRERLAFRDALCIKPALAQAYAELKLRLATEYRNVREAYPEAKEPFIRAALAQADAPV